MHYRTDIANPGIERRLREALTEEVAYAAVSMPVLFVDEERLDARGANYGEAVVLILEQVASVQHMPLLRGGRVHDMIDVDALSAQRLRAACLRADATAKLVNDALATRALEREHFIGTPLALIRTAVDGKRFIAANPAMVQLLGYHHEREILRLNPATDVYHNPDDRLTRFDEFRSTGLMPAMTFPVKRRGGEVIEVVHQAALVLDHLEQPVYIEGSFIDITELAEARRKVEELNRDLLSAHRKAGMAEIAAGVLHNVGNAMNSVKVAMSTLEEKLSVRRGNIVVRQMGEKLGTIEGANEEERQLLDKLAALCARLANEMEQRGQGIWEEMEAANRGLEHVTEVVSRQQRHARLGGAREPTDLGTLVKDAVSLCITESDIDLEMALDADVFALLDKHLFLQIFNNLLRNAVHSVQAVSSREPRISVTLVSAQGHATLTVTDNGVGISRENQDRLFDYGFTTKTSGHGFGLHSCAIALQEMGGEMRAHSDGPDCGAEFTLVLPLTEPPVAMAAAG